MTASPSFRQSAPDRLEIRSGGGCLSLFGIPFIAAGIFLILIAVQILPVSNAEEVPLWGWPVMLLMGLVFVAFSSGLVFGRTQVIIDSSASRVTKQWRLLVPVRQEEHSPLDYRVVVLRFSAGDSDSADSYDVSLQGEGGRPSLALFSVTEYGPALTQAGSVAQLLRLPLLDATTDHEMDVNWDWVEQNLSQRLAIGNQRPFGGIEASPTMESQVLLEGQTVRIRIPNPAMSRFELLFFVIPFALLLYLGPRVLAFFNATETPRNIQICASGFILLFLVGMPLLTIVNDTLRARRGATIVTASPFGIVLEQRGAWSSQTKTIPAAEILGLDYSTPESSLRSAERAAAQHMAAGRAAPAAEPDDPRVWGAGGSSPGRLRWLGRLIRGQGVVIKSRQGLVAFGAGLPDPEVHYLWALVMQALEGSLDSDPQAADSSRQGEQTTKSWPSTHQGKR